MDVLREGGPSDEGEEARVARDGEPPPERLDRLRVTLRERHGVHARGQCDDRCAHSPPSEPWVAIGRGCYPRFELVVYVAGAHAVSAPGGVAPHRLKAVLRVMCCGGRNINEWRLSMLRGRLLNYNNLRSSCGRRSWSRLLLNYSGMSGWRSHRSVLLCRSFISSDHPRRRKFFP